MTIKNGEEIQHIQTADLENREIEKNDNSVTVTYKTDSVTVTEKYEMKDKSLRWEIGVKNNADTELEILDWGLPMAFNQYWTAQYQGEELYDTRCVYHSFVGKNSSYIYALRPSGQGKMLLFTPDVSTEAGFEYKDHWRVNNGHANSAFAQDQQGFSSGLDVFYIHSADIQKTGSGYMPSSSLTLEKGKEKVYAFEFTAVNDEDDLKRNLYQKNIVDAVFVPSTVVSIDMPCEFYLHVNDNVKIKEVSVDCIHETELYSSQENSVSNNLPHSGEADIKYKKKVIYNGEAYHVYTLDLKCLGVNHVNVCYEVDGVTMNTMFQLYAMEKLDDAIERRSQFMVFHQTDTPNEVGDKTFDDWMMDDKKNRADVTNGYWNMSYWGYGDDWALTHGEFLAQKNVYSPIKDEIEAVDEYLDVAIWNTLMREHQEDYLIHDFLSSEPNLSPTYRGYAYPHIYNTYFAMYEIADLYPDIVQFKEDKGVYLMRAYNILCALYSDKVAYNWATGLMGEMTTPDIIEALEKEGFGEEAENVRQIMSQKYDNFKNTKYPYGSEYSYDNTGEEAVYTLAKMNDNAEMMYKIDLKTRACRGLQPVWYYYSNPVTICGENWWNFQYTAATAGYCMDDYLRNVSDSTNEVRALAERMNYAGKLANFTCINSGQIDSDIENIGTVAWTYQAELGNDGGQGTGGGMLHNGWRQMAGEADLGLYAAVKIASSDVANDPVFGLFGYGCEVVDRDGEYSIIPHDGVFAKLNLIDDMLYVSLQGATYSKAVIKKDLSEMTFDMKSVADYVKVRLDGIDGRYALYENGVLKATSSDGEFIYQPQSEAEVLIKKATDEENILPYQPKKAVAQVPERNEVTKVECDFENESTIFRFVGNVHVENGRVVNKSVADYVRLSSDMTYNTEDFTLKTNFSFDNEQKNGATLWEFSDMDGKFVSVSFGESNAVVLNVNGKIASEVCMPNKFSGELKLIQKGNIITLYVNDQKAAQLESDFTLSQLGDVQRNYIGRSHDDTTAVFVGSFGDFSFERVAENVPEKSVEAVGVSAQAVAAQSEEDLPKNIFVTYSDGFVRKTAVQWQKDDEGFFASAGGLIIRAHMRNAEIGENMALDGVPTASYCASWESVEAINDGVYTMETSNPPSDEILRFGTWTRDSSEEWIAITWDVEKTVSAIGLVFVDDGGGTRAPVSYNVEYQDENGKWKDVELPIGGKNELKAMNVTTFESVTTKSIRVTMQKGTYDAVGVMELEIY